MTHSNHYKWLLHKTEHLIAADEYKQALTCLNKLTRLEPNNAHVWQKRAFTHQMLDMPGKSIEDMSMAIQLDPDESSYYWARGALITYITSIDRQISDEARRRQLEQADQDYHHSLSLDPTCTQVWLDLIELSIITSEHDNAVALYGSCRPYIDKPVYQLIRAWLGCIAMALSGEPPTLEDERPLHDLNIRLMKTHWRISEIADYLQRKKKQKKNVCIKTAMAIHDQFVSHFEETPW